MPATGLACQHVPVLTVTYTSRPLRWTAKGTSSVMYPNALKGWNRGGCGTMPSRYAWPLLQLASHHGADSLCATRLLSAQAP